MDYTRNVTICSDGTVKPVLWTEYQKASKGKPWSKTHFIAICLSIEATDNATVHDILLIQRKSRFFDFLQVETFEVLSWIWSKVWQTDVTIKNSISGHVVPKRSPEITIDSTPSTSAHKILLSLAGHLVQRTFSPSSDILDSHPIWVYSNWTKYSARSKLFARNFKHSPNMTSEYGEFRILCIYRGDFQRTNCFFSQHILSGSLKSYALLRRMIPDSQIGYSRSCMPS